MPWVLRVQLTLEAPQHVIGVHLTRGLEIIGGLELHAVAQVEGVAEAVRADVPAFGQARCGIAGAGFERYQTVENSFRRGVGRDGRRVLHNIETFRAGLGADHQGFG